MHSDSYIYKFMILITLISSLVLSFAYTSLKTIQDLNVVVDKQKNVLKSLGINSSSMNSEEIQQKYLDTVKEIVVDINGDIVETINHVDLILKEDGKTGESIYKANDTRYLPIYKSSDSYVIPISGKGLWSTLFGFFALELDMNTVKGITFFKHKETPGLGGEVDKEWFQDNFKGKKIFNDLGVLVGIDILKGITVDDINEDKRIHSVDGISGATVTSVGLKNFLLSDLNLYKNFIENVKKQ